MLTNGKFCDSWAATALLQEILHCWDIPFLGVVPSDGRSNRGRAHRNRKVHRWVEALKIDVDATGVEFAEVGEEEANIVWFLAVHEAKELNLTM